MFWRRSESSRRYINKKTSWDNRVKVLSYLIYAYVHTHTANKRYGTTLTSKLKTHRPISVLPTTSRAAGCLCFSRRRSVKDAGLYHVTRLDLNVKKLASYSAARSFTRRTYKMRQNDSRWNRDETLSQSSEQYYSQLECGPMPNVMAALPNIGGALCSMPPTDRYQIILLVKGEAQRCKQLAQSCYAAAPRQRVRTRDFLIPSRTPNPLRHCASPVNDYVHWH